MLTYMDHRIIASMARTLFVCAWADVEENAGRSYPGTDLMSVAPETTDEAKQEAYYLAGKVAQMNGKSLLLLIIDAAKADGIPHPEKYIEGEYADDFGYCIAMQSLGHGIAWTDNHAEFGLKLPHIEFYLEPEEQTA